MLLYLSWRAFKPRAFSSFGFKRLLSSDAPPFPSACKEMSMTFTQMAAPVFLGNGKSATLHTNFNPLIGPALSTFPQPPNLSWMWPRSDRIDTAMKILFKKEKKMDETLWHLGEKESKRAVHEKRSRNQRRPRLCWCSFVLFWNVFKYFVKNESTTWISEDLDRRIWSFIRGFVSKLDNKMIN